MKNQRQENAALTKLAWFFRRNGYIRRQNHSRVKAEGFQKYKKGDEIRLVANSVSELDEIRHLLSQAGIKAGRPFRKSNQFRQPIYGREQIAFFLSAVVENKQRQAFQRTPLRGAAEG